MFGFTYYTPTKVLFGKDGEKQVGKLVAEFGGTRVLIHYGGKSALKSGLIDRVKAALDEEGIFHVELGGVVPNPHLGKVREGIELAKENGIDFLLAVGGGSVIDSSKAIAYALAEPDKDVWELFEAKRPAKGCFPVGSVLTIAAAGSEMSNSCVITNELTAEKRSYNDDIARPRFAVMNPDLTKTLPDYQTESGCTDIMMHTMERYFTQGGNMEVTDEIAEGILRTVMKYAEILHKDPENYEARAEVMWAGSLAHNNLTGCGNDGGDFVTHMMEHELGGMFDVTHGAGLAAIWPSWARYVYKECMPRFVRYAIKVMGVKDEGQGDEAIALEGIHQMEEFYHRIGMPINMRELGVEPTDEQIIAMAESCERACGGKKGSAKVLYLQDMIEVYRMAL
ncbi:MAG: iron-containing alcohol dehydrogenase [Eubacterium sp.]|nr:iron-containing alcohol dehydrogenase [Eubacterium sp.]MBQ6363419.1 iron-containing alcohol dehydrogenase [Lachnospiraceae bacterium]